TPPRSLAIARPWCYRASAPARISTLSLHDALPICMRRQFGDRQRVRLFAAALAQGVTRTDMDRRAPAQVGQGEIDSSVAPERRRSEEHTSELPSRANIVCRPLPEKKKKTCSATSIP